jgi:DNA-binding transcriptional ArsR family regulator
MSESKDEILRSIQRTLEEIRSLFILTNRDKLEKGKETLLPKGSIKEKIYNLCDGNRTISDMTKEIGKDDNYVRSYLSILRRDGLIRSIERDGKLVHEQII